jgi:hypothetical protein
VLLEKFSKQVEEHGIIERQPVLEGKSMFIVLASTHKPKVVEPGQKPHRAEDGNDDEPSTNGTDVAVTATTAVTAPPAPVPVVTAPVAAPAATNGTNGAEPAKAATPTTGD